MRHSLDIPIIGADDDLVQRLVAENNEQKRKGARKSVRSTDNRRQQVRYDITRPVAVFPMLESLEVDPGGQIDGIIVDVSDLGLGLRLASKEILPGDNLIVAVESDERGWRFLNVVVKNAIAHGSDSTRVHASLDGPLHRLFQDDLLLPTFDSQKFQYSMPFADRVFTSLCAIGAAQRVLLDEVLACPDCLSLPTLRRGCSVCLSSETEKSRMIHHFACANVDFVDQFDHGEEIVCPKCLGRKMIVGADYEYLDGPIQCRECGHNDLEEIMIGHCMRCSHRFPFENAEKLEVVGYRVNRLDPLALLD